MQPIAGNQGCTGAALRQKVKLRLFGLNLRLQNIRRIRLSNIGELMRGRRGVHGNMQQLPPNLYCSAVAPGQRKTVRALLLRYSSAVRQRQFRQPCVAPHRPVAANAAFPRERCSAGQSLLVRRRGTSRRESAHLGSPLLDWAIARPGAPNSRTRGQPPVPASMWDWSLAHAFSKSSSFIVGAAFSLRRADREPVGFDPT